MNEKNRNQESSKNKNDIIEILYGPKTLGTPEEEAKKSVSRIFGGRLSGGDYETKKRQE